jgi:hypothetical protein
MGIMKWIRTHNGDKAHAVAHRDHDKTLCGIRLEHAGAIVDPDTIDRCGNCDFEWRKRGKASRPKGRKNPKNIYRPRFVYRDWEEET